MFTENGKNQEKLEKKQKKNKFFQRMFGLELKVVFFVFLEFVLFFWGMQKQTLSLFGCLMIKVPKKQKTQGKPTFCNGMMELIYVKTRQALFVFVFFTLV